jgi:hypothetical protein
MMDERREISKKIKHTQKEDTVTGGQMETRRHEPAAEEDSEEKGQKCTR